MKSFLVIKSYTAILFGFRGDFATYVLLKKIWRIPPSCEPMKESVTHVLPSLIITFFVSSNI